MTHASTKTQHRKENSFIRGTQDCEGAQCMVPAFYSILNVQSTCVAPLSKQILHSEILRDACCTSECSCPSLYSQACILHHPISHVIHVAPLRLFVPKCGEGVIHGHTVILVMASSTIVLIDHVIWFLQMLKSIVEKNLGMSGVSGNSMEKGLFKEELVGSDSSDIRLV